MKFSKNRKEAKTCPCGKSNKDLKFAPYEGFSKYGYCHSCGKTFQPDNSVIIDTRKLEKIHLKPSLIKSSLLDISIESAKKNSNNFLSYIKEKYGAEKSEYIQKKFLIGNSSRWPGSCVFWQVDEKMKVRSGKVLLYDPVTGKRYKRKNDWIHSILLRKNIISEFKLKQCLFGLHQIHNMSLKQLSNTRVAVVESAKSACVMTIVCPSIIWMSCESLHGLQLNKFQALKSCNIVFYPDLGKGKNDPFELWSNRSLQFNKLGYKTRVSDLLVNNATIDQINEKQDIADFF
ncbi:DUF6371 domain-containing protein [Nonlabens ulvanivorans]|uniref:DUF6371 domain-containing protein n=1 Tax=Nonlabens ulvanivorans TaxID=906888 RepID=UPI0037C76294